MRSKQFSHFLLRSALAMLALLLFSAGGSGSVWGQTHPYAGVWYLQCKKNTSYYVVPAANPQITTAGHVNEDAYFSSDYSTQAGDPEMPFITTCPTSKDANSIWIFVPVSGEDNYYYIVHALTGKYVKYQTYLTGDNARRKYVHLETMATPGETEKFEITALNTGVKIKPKSNNMYFNVAGDNQNRYNGGNTSPYYSGIIGGMTGTDDNSQFNLIKADTSADLTPVISDVNTTTGTFTITSPAEAFSTIRYTTDGSTTPDASTGTSIAIGTPIVITASWTVQAVGVFGSFVTPVATKSLAPGPCAQPVITFDNTTSNVTITCVTPSSTIYYTTDGSVPTTSSTEYSGPFTVASPTTVKAIATHATLTTSSVAELAISQVATPTIQNNGSNAISITTSTPGATIYYTTDGSNPTASSTEYIAPLTENVSNVTIKAIAVKAGMITSAVGSGVVKLQCATPVITRDGMTFTLSCSKPTDADLYYTLDGGPEEAYTGTPVAFTTGQLPMTVTAVARHSDYTQSGTASMELINGSGTPADPYLIYGTSDFSDFVTKVNNGTTAAACYKLGSDVSASGMDAITMEFTGTFDGDGYTISDLGHALFNSVNGGVVKNVILDNVSISSGTNVGAIANEVTGTSTQMASIYNCGILSGSVSGSGKVGSIVGQLGDADAANCYARVVNCYSYATVSGGSDVGGIVGYNSFASTAGNIRTMVMNCMFYGDITGGTNVSPVFGGNNIANLLGGLNTFNYYAFDKATAFDAREEDETKKYNSALAVEDRYLDRFEFYRLLLNSNKKLAAFYATGSVDNSGQMLKWVLETADRTIDTPKPYPVLKAQGYYPSIINPDVENAPDSALVGRNHGGKLGRTLSVTISSEQTTGGQTKPAGATITTSSLTLVRTDKDFDRFNYNYDKVQLPYYNDVGTGNYTDNRVVTGWKITAITAVPGDPYTEANYDYSKTYASNQSYFDYPNYNFADRKSSNKDLYSVSGRVFSQGAYFDVPYGVTEITIEPYWGKAYYIADQNYDVVYKADYTGKQGVSQTGTQVNTSTTTFNGQKVETSIERALNNIAASTASGGLGGLGPTVYDNALVLVGNLHLNTVPQNGTNAFTMMSVDEDNDHEPDYSLIYHHTGRSNITPIRYDFLNIIGTAQAQKPNNASLICNFTIFKTRGWFEVTNTALFYTSQLEYENLADCSKSDAPFILLGGVVDQFVSTQNKAVTGKTIYIHVGGNVWIKEFGMGTHSDGKESTPHVPVSVTGGEFPGFYLTGTYNADATARKDSAECYISGGYFHEAAGASLEQIDGSVRWQIYNADIDNFYGGGINDAKPITGNVTVEIFNSHVTTYCGGPKFGNMQAGKKVTTRAEGCVFGTYFGAGFGGTSLTKKKYFDNTSPNFSDLQKHYYDPGSSAAHHNEKGKYYDGATTNAPDARYGKKGPGVATDFDYEFFVWTSGLTGARFYINYVAFSLARCNDVTSNLSGCTITGNFYGGGSLGSVAGSVTSVLDNCKVYGNVYGAGYSATIPSLEVRDAGFASDGSGGYLFPVYNSNSGMFEPGIFSGATEYTWKNAAEAGVTLTNGELGSDATNHYIYTDVNLDNLGSVDGNVSLTIRGASQIGHIENDEASGNVFGGGEESKVGKEGDDTQVTVTIAGKTEVFGNVYGGGNQGEVVGNTKVILTE